MSDSKAMTTPAPEGNALVQLLSDADRLKDFPVETVERLFRLDQERIAMQARREFAVSKNAVQSAMLPIKKKGRNSDNGSAYALLEHIQSMLDPILADNGFSYSFSMADCPRDAEVRVVMRLSHIGGHEEEHFLDAPIDNVGPKGGATKTRLHGMGSTMTYCERILLTKVFGVQTFKDDDGNAGAGVGPGAKPITEEQAATLSALLKEVGADVARFCKFFGIDKPEDMPTARYREALTMLEAKRR